MKSVSSGFVGACVLAAVLSGAWAEEPVDYVNTKIGNISHLLVPTFPATGRPNGMLRFLPPNESFLTDRIGGFPLTVPSHRNGSAFRFRPYSGTFPGFGHDWVSTYDQADPKPYRYSVFLDTFDTAIVLAPGRKSAIMAITFEKPAETHAVTLEPQNNGALEIKGRRISGYEDFSGIHVYICAEFDAEPEKTGVIHDNKPDFSRNASGRDAVMAVFSGKAETVRMRYALSYISAEQAAKNLAEELKDFDVEALAKDARKEWNKTLGQVQVEGGTGNDKTVFYTALYRCYERMVDITEDGKYFSCWDRRVHDSEGVPFYTDDWTWDTYRAKHPLMVMLRPGMESQCLTAYIRMCQQSGWMPTFPTVAKDVHCMNGQHAVALFIDAWRKGVRTFDFGAAYDGMKKTILEESAVPWYRGPLTELDRFYWQNGFFPALHPGEKETVPGVGGERRQSVAVTLAASYDTWCLSQMAAELGRKDDEAFFLKHAHDYRNLWKADTGFFHPKDKEGKWIEPFDYKYSGGMGARDYYDENNGWTYIWDVQHNIADLIRCFGGRERFVAKLDQMFNEGPDRARWDFYAVLPDSTGTTGMFIMGNEPSFHIPYLYNYAGQPWKTQKLVRKLMEAWFRNDLMGICGDEDGGGMSAFAVFSSMGFYPVTPGSPTYALGSPIFTRVTIDLENGKRFTLKAPRANAENKYIQSVKVNGNPCWDTWFGHDVIANGGVVEIEMGDRPNRQWGVAPEAAPFSQDK